MTYLNTAPEVGTVRNGMVSHARNSNAVRGALEPHYMPKYARLDGAALRGMETIVQTGTA